MQKHVNLVDLVKSFPTNIYLRNLASIQKRTSPLKFAHLAGKSEKSSISNLSTKVPGGRSAQPSALDEWSNEYYGEDVRGKSVMEHEDVLHIVNPELFPLQQIHLRQPTPLTPALSTSMSGPL